MSVLAFLNAFKFCGPDIIKDQVYLTNVRFFCFETFNPLNAELNPICHLLPLVGAHHILHVSSVRVKMGND